MLYCEFASLNYTLACCNIACAWACWGDTTGPFWESPPNWNWRQWQAEVTTHCRFPKHKASSVTQPPLVVLLLHHMWKKCTPCAFVWACFSVFKVLLVALTVFLEGLESHQTRKDQAVLGDPEKWRQEREEKWVSEWVSKIERVEIERILRGWVLFLRLGVKMSQDPVVT